MDVYLLDTNHLIALLRTKDAQRRQKIVNKLASLPPDSHLCIATVTVAELEVGSALGDSGRATGQAEIRAAIAQNQLDVLPFTSHTAAPYGAIKAVLIEQYQRKEGKNARKWPEGWGKPTTGEKLGADELDLMLVSHAIERNMVLVSGDPMRRVFDAISPAGLNVRCENWLA